MNATKAFEIRNKLIADTQKAYQSVKIDRLLKVKKQDKEFSSILRDCVNLT